MEAYQIAISIVGVFIIIATNAVIIAIAFQKLAGKIDVTNVNVKVLKEDVTELKNTDRRLAVLEDRQKNFVSTLAIVQRDNQMLRNELNLLRQGKGYIHDPLNRQGIEGEYGAALNDG